MKRECVCNVAGPIVTKAVKEGLSKVGALEEGRYGPEYLGITFEHTSPEGKRFEVVAWVERLHVTCKEKELDG